MDRSEPKKRLKENKGGFSLCGLEQNLPFNSLQVNSKTIRKDIAERVHRAQGKVKNVVSTVENMVHGNFLTDLYKVVLNGFEMVKNSTYVSSRWSYGNKVIIPE